ncbi:MULTISPECIES: hypothetical protein [unclassified Streptomyces]|uniref:hypothetical protein n=1 Tax=unclassified Streptomyces TaxID=2593676 RepID=UPI0006AFF46D|nr:MULTISPECIES: hypothetical protein [unclassified Streptomyces]KOX33039.1 hypothetical protein ADL06_09870 [Streptomyces sp. NRRL F-6491]KOX49539.1 hypothetical protein ADL08_08565 [Streptomyces sp. NRRL F-6492]
MSIHLMIVAAYLPPDVVNQGQKLALMKICDSADDETRLARPGMRRLRAWVGVSKSRCTTIVTELVAMGLVERVTVGRIGRAAVYRVFPMGVPSIPSNEELDARHHEADKAPKNENKARRGLQRARPSKPAMTYRDVEVRKESRAAPEQSERGEEERPQETEEHGQEDQPPKGADGEGLHAWNPPGGEGRVPPVEPLPSFLLPLSCSTPLPLRTMPYRKLRTPRRRAAPATGYWRATAAPVARAREQCARPRSGPRSRRTGRPNARSSRLCRRRKRRTCGSCESGPTGWRQHGGRRARRPGRVGI